MKRRRRKKVDSNRTNQFYKKPSGKSKAYLAGEDFMEIDPDEGDDLSNENADDGEERACNGMFS